MEDLLLMCAGGMGLLVSLIHGVILQKRMVRPFVIYGANSQGMNPPLVRLIPVMVHYSTLCWFVVGVSLVAAPHYFDDDGRTIVSAIGVAVYGSAALINAWATRGRHPGWMMLTAAVVLIVFGI